MALNFDHKLLLLIYLCMLLRIAAVLPKTSGTITDLDENLQKKANESYDGSLKASDPHSDDDETDEFNDLVGEPLVGGNTTRRHLNQKVCKATNSIDKCWRCDPNWAMNRKKIVDCVRGFGHDTYGGAKGKYYLVTDPSDNDMDNPKPGTLRHAVIQTEPLWIIFKHDFVITLKQELIMTSDKTIDGRGVEVHIAYGAGLTLQFIHNVIIHNIWIHDLSVTFGGMIRDAINHIGLRMQSDGDAIDIYGSTNIWIDHVSLSKGVDGLIDVIQGSTAITISNCKFNHHSKVMLLGARDEDSKDVNMRVTVAYNRFGKGCIQRMPRVRWGFAHVVNNDYTYWELYAIGGSAHPTIISQGNRFKAEFTTNQYIKEVTHRDYASPEEWKNWQWRSEGDLFKNGAFFVESGPPFVPEKSPLFGDNFLKAMPSKSVGRLTRNAGALKCRVGSLC